MFTRTIHTRTPHTALGRASLALALAFGVWMVATATMGSSRSFASAPIAAPTAEVDEYDVKAAFVFNFARYASWPKGTFAKADSPIVVAVVGKDPFGKKLEAVINKRKIGKRPVIVRRYATAADIKEAHLAVLGKLSSEEQKAAVKTLKKRGALIIADSGGTEKSGASLGFIVDKSKIRFEVHAKNLKASKIRLGSQLLKLAKIVGRK